MTTINRSELKSNIVNAVRAETNDALPAQSANIVTPVIDVNPYPTKISKVVDSLVLSAGSTNVTMKTTSATQDTFITGAWITLQKDAASTTLQTRLMCYIDGAQKQFCSIRCLAGTADSKSIHVSFPYPIKCDRNTTINHVTDATGAAVAILAAFTYFEV